MNKKIDIRYILYQVNDIHKIVYECFNKNNYNDAYLLLIYEFKKYRYIQDNLKSKIMMSSYYLEYAPIIKNKIRDIEFAIEKVNKYIQKIPYKISDETLIKLYNLQLNNLVYYYEISSLLKHQDKKTIYFIFLFLCKKIKQNNKNFFLNMHQAYFFLSLSPFKTH